MNIVIYLLSMFSLTYFIKETEITNRFRIWIIKLHPIFANLLDCYFCLGFWTGLIIYLIANPYFTWNLQSLFLWGLSGSAISFLTSLVVAKLEGN